MGNRTTNSEVQKIIDTEVVDTTPFVTAANLIVTEKLGDQNLGDSLLTEIEKWLAAHLVSVRDPRAKAEKTGDATVTYFGKDGLGLDGSQYGQTVKLLDPTGILANLGKKKASINVIEVDLGVVSSDS